jgi:hypothetical protein
MFVMGIAHETSYVYAKLLTTTVVSQMYCNVVCVLLVQYSKV